jgi:hypothetical protein
MCRVANDSGLNSPDNPVHRFARKGVANSENDFAANVNLPLYVRVFAALRSCKELPFPIMGSLQDY